MNVHPSYTDSATVDQFRLTVEREVRYILASSATRQEGIDRIVNAHAQEVARYEAMLAAANLIMDKVDEAKKHLDLGREALRQTIYTNGESRLKT